jgi:hypothetical protein
MLEGVSDELPPKRRITSKSSESLAFRRPPKEMFSYNSTFSTELVNFGEFYFEGKRCDARTSSIAQRSEAAARMESVRTNDHDEPSVTASSSKGPARKQHFQSSLTILKNKKMQVSDRKKFLTLNRLPNASVGGLGGDNIRVAAGLKAEGESVSNSTVFIFGGLAEAGKNVSASPTM